MVKEARAQYYPTLTASPSLTRSRPSANLQGFGGTGTGAAAGATGGTAVAGTTSGSGASNLSICLSMPPGPRISGVACATQSRATSRPRKPARRISRTPELTAQAELAVDYYPTPHPGCAQGTARCRGVCLPEIARPDARAVRDRHRHRGIRSAGTGAARDHARRIHQLGDSARAVRARHRAAGRPARLDILHTGAAARTPDRRQFRWECLRNCSSDGPTWRPTNGSWRRPMRRSA